MHAYICNKNTTYPENTKQTQNKGKQDHHSHEQFTAARKRKRKRQAIKGHTANTTQFKVHKLPHDHQQPTPTRLLRVPQENLAGTAMNSVESTQELHNSHDPLAN